MSFDVFQREEAVIAQGRAVLAASAIADPSAAAEYEKLLRAYEKLARTTRRLIKLSDRNQEQLNQLAHTLNDKNATLETLSDQLSKTLERIEQELDAARELQSGMVPTFFPPPTSERPIEIFAMMEPAREVGGDLYDFFDAPDGSLCFLVGDVSGKGVPAALFMARTKNLVHLVTDLLRGPSGGSAGPADILGRVNRELCQDNVGMMFVTLFLGMLQPRTGELRFCNAGHGPPYRLRGPSVEPLDAVVGPPLGIRPRAVYETGTLRLDPGDALYIYSDGITEAADASSTLFSEDRLAAVLGNASGGAEDLVSAVAEAVTKFVGGAPPSDDITAMAIRLVES